MNIEQLIKELDIANSADHIMCSIPKEDIHSEIYLVGQVKEDVPGIILGEREPAQGKKDVGSFIKELNTFGSRFHSNDFLLELTHQINNEKYEFRYYKLTDIVVEDNKIIFISNMGELLELREQHEDPELE